MSDNVQETIDFVYPTIKSRQRSGKPTGNTDRNGIEYVPPPSLTKGELLALYDAAINNRGGGIVPATLAPQETDDNSGYYYYYYPLNSFAPSDGDQHPHLHTHHHNVKIHTSEDTGGGEQPPKGSGLVNFIHNIQHGRFKALEPLFMAVSSFMGMAMMFFFSMIFMPRLSHFKSRADVPNQRPPTSLSDVVLKAIDGQDCNERLFCEAGRVLRVFHLADNRFVKFFQRLAPETVASGIEKARRMANINKKCIQIQCKKRPKQPPKTRTIPPKNPKNQQNKNKKPKRPP